MYIQMYIDVFVLWLHICLHVYQACEKVYFALIRAVCDWVPYSSKTNTVECLLTTTITRTATTTKRPHATRAIGMAWRHEFSLQWPRWIFGHTVCRDFDRRGGSGREGISGVAERSLMFAQRFLAMSFVDDETLELNFANCIFIICVLVYEDLNK